MTEKDAAAKQSATGAREALLAALDADDQRARAATPGPWSVHYDEFDAPAASVVTAEFVPVLWTYDPDELRDAEHIAAHDPETVLRRTTALGRAVAAADAMRAEIDAFAVRQTGTADHGMVNAANVWRVALRALADAYAPGWNAPVADSEVGL